MSSIVRAVARCVQLLGNIWEGQLVLKAQKDQFVTAGGDAYDDIQHALQANGIATLDGLAQESAKLLPDEKGKEIESYLNLFNASTGFFESPGARQQMDTQSIFLQITLHSLATWRLYTNIKVIAAQEFTSLMPLVSAAADARATNNQEVFQSIVKQLVSLAQERQRQGGNVQVAYAALAQVDRNVQAYTTQDPNLEQMISIYNSHVK